MFPSAFRKFLDNYGTNERRGNNKVKKCRFKARSRSAEKKNDSRFPEPIAPQHFTTVFPALRVRFPNELFFSPSPPPLFSYNLSSLSGIPETNGFRGGESLLRTVVVHTNTLEINLMNLI